MGYGKKCKRGITVPYDGGPLSQPPQSLRDSSPIPYGTGEPFALYKCFLNSYAFLYDPFAYL